VKARTQKGFPQEANLQWRFSAARFPEILEIHGTLRGYSVDRPMLGMSPDEYGALDAFRN